MSETHDKKPPLRLGVLFSGGGRTLQNLADHNSGGELNARIVTAISSRGDAYGLQRAVALNIPSHVVERKAFAGDVRAFSQRIFDLLRRAEVELVCLAGWLSLLEIPDDFARRVINIHPALLPSFGGRGMYGHHVHEAVLAAGCKVTGCTVHFADQTYDTGPIIVQRCCPVLEGDTPDSLAARVFEQECIAYPEAVAMIAAGRVRIEDRTARIHRP